MKKSFLIILIVATILLLIVDVSVAIAPTITNFQVSPNSSINQSKPAKISANVTGNMAYVTFLVIDNNNLVMRNRTAIFDYTNWSGVNGKYQTAWNGKLLEIINNNGIRSYVHPTYGYGINLGWSKDKLMVPADFKKNASTPNRTVILWYNKTTYRLVNITTFNLSNGNTNYIKQEKIEPGISNIRIIHFEFVNGIDKPSTNNISQEVYKLYNFGDSRNPYLISSNAPTGDYKVLVHSISKTGDNIVLNRNVNVLSPCDNGYSWKEGIIAGATSFGPYTWTGKNFAAFWHPMCEPKEYAKIIQPDLGGNNRTVKKGNMIYNSTRKIIPYVVFMQTGKKVESALDENGNKLGYYGEGGFYARISCAGRPCVGINGNSTKMSRILLEQTYKDPEKVLGIGDVWQLKEGWNVTAIAIDAKSNPRQVWLMLTHNGTKKDDKVLAEGDVYSYVERSIANEYDVPMFVTYISNISAGAYSDYVSLKYTWLISDNIKIVKIGDNCGLFNVTKADKFGVELKNYNNIYMKRDSTNNLCGKFYGVVKDNSSLEYLPIMVRYDKTPPNSISGLKNISYASNYINWTWKEPIDLDFIRVKVYINGIYKQDVTKGIKYYNATGLNSNSWYKISTRTVDLSENINRTWVNNSAKTK